MQKENNSLMTETKNKKFLYKLDDINLLYTVIARKYFLNEQNKNITISNTSRQNSRV